MFDTLHRFHAPLPLRRTAPTPFRGTTFSIALVGLLLSISIAWGQRFPFVISGFDAAPTATDFSYLSPRPAGEDGFVRIEDGHFATDSGRLRIWGVNFCFGAIFPSHEEAEQVAAHLAKIGVNGVRIHHHETSSAPRGLYRKDGTLDPEQVDRLDYFLAALHQQGIYVNLNMHVGRTVSKQLGLPGLGTQHYLMHDKHALHFQREIRAAFWDFCREYLQHVNPYRKMRRADDPGIAMVELCNENKFSEAGPGALLAAPEPYRSQLIRPWNAWLVKRYGDTAGLRKAWYTGEKVEDRVMADSSQWTTAKRGGWTLSDNGGKSPITATPRTDSGQTVLRFDPQERGTQGWHQQFSSPSLTVTEGKTYLLRFDARADVSRNVGMHLATTATGKWTPLGLSQQLELNDTWKSLSFRFQPPQTVSKAARLAFDLGGVDGAVELRNLQLVEGGSAVSVPDGQTLEAENVDLPGHDWSDQSRGDFKAFMLDTEHDFYSRTLQLLKEEIGVRVPITTTQANYQPISVAAQLANFADMHAYWHHPIFPGRSWDGNNWHVQNETLVAYPFSDKWPRVNLMMRSAWRLQGKPFTFSEWNTGEPGYFSADAIPIAAMIASLQDWDAVFFFNYQSGGDWNPDKIGGYFEINGQPVKTALIAALANLYRRGDLAALKELASAAPGKQDGLGALALRYQVGIDPELADEASHPVPTAEHLELAENRLIETPDRSVVWDARDPQQAHVTIDTRATKCVWGLVAGKVLKLGVWQVQFGEMERDYAVLVATSRDGLAFEKSRSILLTAVANAENQDMGWNADRTSVGTNWGHGPTVVNGVPVRLAIPASQVARRLFALDSAGNRGQEVQSNAERDGFLVFDLGPKWKTLFYELTAE